MLVLARVTGFEWDAGNARKSEDRHGVSQAEAEQAFFNDPLLVAEDVTHSQMEPRFHALGRTDVGRALHVVFTLRNDGLCTPQPVVIPPGAISPEAGGVSLRAGVDAGRHPAFTRRPPSPMSGVGRSRREAAPGRLTS